MLFPSKSLKQYIFVDMGTFVVSVDVMMGREAGMLFKQLGRKLTQKWECPYYKPQNYIDSMMSVTIVRATHHFLRGVTTTVKINEACSLSMLRWGRDWPPPY